MRDLDIIEEGERHKSERVNRSLDMSRQLNHRETFSIKPKRKVDYSHRIKELESRLRK